MSGIRSALRFYFAVCTMTLVVVVAGCALFDEAASGLSGDAGGSIEHTTFLPPIQAPQNAIKLDIVLVELPEGDPLLGPALWQEVDQVGALSTEVRETLQQSGFRVGHVSTSLPPALERMLDMSADGSFESDAAESGRIIRRSFFLRPGGETEITAGEAVPMRTVMLEGSDGSYSREFENALCMFRMRVKPLQDGWAEIEMRPEIHYGENVFRRVANKEGWKGRTTQQIHPLYRQRFSLKLHVGEMGVVTAGGDDPEALGNHFFAVGDGEHPTARRVLIIRLADMAG